MVSLIAWQRWIYDGVRSSIIEFGLSGDERSSRHGSMTAIARLMVKKDRTVMVNMARLALRSSPKRWARSG
ncbi:MAG: hypothetical protein Tsb0019_23360 [Roseibium sp.]